MNTTELLKKAWIEVKDADLPEHVQGAALQIAATRVDAEDRVSESRLRRGTSTVASERVDAPVDMEGFAKHLAEASGVPEHAVEQVFHIDDGMPRLNLPARRLGTTAKDQMQAVAYLLAPAQQLGLGVRETETKLVRAECRRLSCLDEKNFNSAMQDLVGITYSGPRTGKVLKIRPAGVEAFRSLMERLVGAT